MKLAGYSEEPEDNRQNGSPSGEKRAGKVDNDWEAFQRHYALGQSGNGRVPEKAKPTPASDTPAGTNERKKEEESDSSGFEFWFWLKVVVTIILIAVIGFFTWAFVTDSHCKFRDFLFISTFCLWCITKMWSGD